ncbi:exonuclease subunit SbcD [Sinomonas sp. JGH33]|uniref:Nuclease SbcCD subunit D n=1 Tax=Sinomonas terricola TaxID=3110330 RepID=A0ABU5T901_9MICC|nr:exonuclease SbcCD subunit D C-terminal domain-containing protein [Sinomonas sp. JGH33]MEA5456142.1 exonuclease subunit SbcD [Sinomonas sp. JGH33]
MKILHTSDWHLGRSFHGLGLLAVQGEWLDGLVDYVAAERVDAVLVAGDVYDRALPAVDVVALLDRTLVRLTEAGARVILTSGNHDSAVRLGFGSRLLERAGVHLRTRVAELDEPVLIGGTDGTQLAVYGLPYLEPRLVAGDLGVDEPGHTPVTRAALERVRADLAHRREGRPGPGLLHAVVMAHTFASGGVSAESERALAVGGLDVVSAEEFAGFDYVALGHLHGRQKLTETIRYSGSPLAYSFGEARQSKGAWLLDFDETGLAAASEVGWTTSHRLEILRGQLDELLSDPELSSAEGACCQITLTDAERPQRAMERLRSRFPLTLSLHFDPVGGAELGSSTYHTRLVGARDDLEVCSGFLEHVRGRGPGESERAALTRALDAVRLEEASR